MCLSLVWISPRSRIQVTVRFLISVEQSFNSISRFWFGASFIFGFYVNAAWVLFFSSVWFLLQVRTVNVFQSVLLHSVSFSVRAEIIGGKHQKPHSHVALRPPSLRCSSPPPSVLNGLLPVSLHPIQSH